MYTLSIVYSVKSPLVKKFDTHTNTGTNGNTLPSETRIKCPDKCITKMLFLHNDTYPNEHS